MQGLVYTGCVHVLSYGSGRVMAWLFTRPCLPPRGVPQFPASFGPLPSPPQAQLNGRELGWAPLNRLCWAIGSISGSMVEDQENRWATLITASAFCSEP